MRIAGKALRREDMSTTGNLCLLRQRDGDIIVSVYDATLHAIGSVEFCTPGAGGGRSPRTHAALVELLRAMAEDNADTPIAAADPAANEPCTAGSEPTLKGAIAAMERAKTLRTWDRMPNDIHKELDTIFAYLADAKRPVGATPDTPGTPAPDQVLREVVNGLGDTAVQFHDKQQRRERIRACLDPLFPAKQAENEKQIGK